MTVRWFNPNPRSNVLISIFYFLSLVIQSGCGAGGGAGGAGGGGGLPSSDIPPLLAPSSGGGSDNLNTGGTAEQPPSNVSGAVPVANEELPSSGGYTYDPLSNQCIDEKGAVGTSSELQGPCSNLSGKTITNNDYSKANLTGADFSGSTISGVNFGNAVLEGAKFDNSKLNSVNLWGAILTDSTFSGATISNSDISDPIIYDYIVAAGIIIGSGNTLPITITPEAQSPAQAEDVTPASTSTGDSGLANNAADSGKSDSSEVATVKEDSSTVSSSNQPEATSTENLTDAGEVENVTVEEIVEVEVDEEVPVNPSDSLEIAKKEKKTKIVKKKKQVKQKKIKKVKKHKRGHHGKKHALKLALQRDEIWQEIGGHDKALKQYIDLSTSFKSQIQNLRTTGPSLASNSHLFAEKQDASGGMWLYGNRKNGFAGPKGVIGYQIRGLQKGLRVKQLDLANHRVSYRLLGQKVRNLNKEIHELQLAMSTTEKMGFYMELYAQKAKNSVARFVATILG